MSDKKVSIIVPVYNVEKYIKRCAASLFAQTYQNIEIIFVDDGSSDRSLEILRDIERTDPRVFVLSQQNAGPSAARNRGIKQATGQYIMFCDSDDTVSENWCEALVKGITEYPNAWVTCDIYVVDENGERLETYTYGTTDQLLSKDEYYHFFKSGLSGSANNKVFVAEIIKRYNIVFDEDSRIGEDVRFNVDYFRHTSGIVNVSGCTYQYYRYASMTTLTNQYHTDEFDIQRRLYMLRKPVIADRYRDEFDRHYWHVLLKTVEDNLYLYSRESLIKRIRENNHHIRTEEFQYLLQYYGKDELPTFCCQRLKQGDCFGYWLIQMLSRVKRQIVK